jgi:hypothetical protein
MPPCLESDNPTAHWLETQFLSCAIPPFGAGAFGSGNELRPIQSAEGSPTGQLRSSRVANCVPQSGPSLISLR